MVSWYEYAVRDEVRIVDAVHAGRLHQASELIFAYIAATQTEIARPVPSSPADLPLPLRTECDDPRTAYPPPGTILIADRAAHPIGCVALRQTGPTAAEVKRLYVHPGHRGGVGRALVQRLHQHAAEHGLHHLVLDVLGTRRHAIELYRSLGYTEIEPPPTTSAPLLLMQRRL
jgi:ribosomal protein S18 acetylase RimI-like enzyme